MHIAVDDRAGNPRQSERKHTTHCVIVYVALDANGAPIDVPTWEPKTDEEKAMQNYAVKLMDLRKGIEKEMRPFIERD
jgi:acyl-CoA hydrolase